MKSIFFILVCIVSISSLRGLDKYIAYVGEEHKTNITQKKPIYIKENKKKDILPEILAVDTTAYDQHIKQKIPNIWRLQDEDFFIFPSIEINNMNLKYIVW